MNWHTNTDKSFKVDFLRNSFFCGDQAEMVTEHEYDYTSGNPALYVGTYHKYNSGSIEGMWVDMTTFRVK